MQTYRRTGHQCRAARGCVYLGSANVQTQHFSSDLQRLCMEDLSYHPETRLGKKMQGLRHRATLTNSPKTDPGCCKTDDTENFISHVLHSPKHNEDFRCAQKQGVLPC